MIDAFQVPPDCYLTEPFLRWCLESGLGYPHLAEPDAFGVETLEGTMLARRGDWIIKGVKGEFYPIKNDIFEQTYDKEPE